MPDRAYTDAALVDSHPPVSSLVPKRIWLIGAMILTLTATILLLNLLSSWSPKWAEKYGAQQVMAFDMTVGRGLVKWLSSFLLVVAAFYCMQVYLIRRHRNDDYRGTYRLWVWLAVALLAASVDATAGFHGFLINLGRNFAREQFHFDNHFGWSAAVLAPLFCLAARVLMEIRRSPGSVAAFLLASVSFVFALLLRMNFFAVNAHLEDVMQCNSLLVGYMSLFLCTTCYARFVYLDSHGVLAELAEKRAERLAAKEAKRKEQEALHATRSTEKMELKKKEQEKETKQARRNERDSAVKQSRAKEMAEPQQIAEKAKPKAVSKQSAGKAELSATEKKPASSTSPLTNRIKSSKSNSKTSASAEAKQQIPAAMETSKNNAADQEEQRATISLEEMQRQLNESKSRSERKRLQKMMKREQRRAA